MLPITVHSGDTLSGIAAQYGTSYQAIAADSGISDPNRIYAGETVYVPSGGSFHSWEPSSGGRSSSHTSLSYHSQSQVSGYSSSSSSRSSGGSLSDVPGMPSSLASCIAYRESTNNTNPAAHGNAYGIIPASGYNVAGDSLAQQQQVAGQIYAKYGGAAWAADGCPGT